MIKHEIITSTRFLILFCHFEGSHYMTLKTAVNRFKSVFANKKPHLANKNIVFLKFVQKQEIN